MQKEIRDYWNESLEDPYDEYLDFETKAERRERLRGVKMKVSGGSLKTITRKQIKDFHRGKGS